MVTLSLTEKQALNSISLLFGENYKDIKELFESVGIYAILAYMKEEKINIPFIGEIDLSYEGDEVVDKGRIAKVKSSFVPSPFLVRNIGQIADKGVTDAEKILMSRFQSVFKERIEKN